MSIRLKYVIVQEKEESGLIFGTTRVRFYIVANISTSRLVCLRQGCLDNTSVLQFHRPRKR